MEVTDLDARKAVQTLERDLLGKLDVREIVAKGRYGDIFACDSPSELGVVDQICRERGESRGTVSATSRFWKSRCTYPAWFVMVRVAAEVRSGTPEFAAAQMGGSEIVAISAPS